MNVISAEEVKARLDAGESVNLVDVREPYEHAEFNIGGILHPLGRIQSMDIEGLENLRNEEVIFYCRSGARSSNACLIMEQQQGFTNVKNLTNGMMGWQQTFGSK